RRRRSFGLAHAPEQRVHVGPEALPLLALVFRELGEGIRGADRGKVVVGLPVPHPQPDLDFGPGVAVVERLAPPGEVLPQPFAGLPAPAGALLVIQRVRVPAAATTRQRRGAGPGITGAWP